MSGPGFVDGVPVERAISEAFSKHLAPRRADAAFMARLAKRVEEDKPILDRLEAMEHDEQNAVVDAAMTGPVVLAAIGAVLTLLLLAVIHHVAVVLDERAALTEDGTSKHGSAGANPRQSP